MRYNNGPEVTDLATAEICRRNFIDALQQLNHPVMTEVMIGTAEMLSNHPNGCECSICLDYLKVLDNREWRAEIERKNKTAKRCKEDDCDNVSSRRGMCDTHYRRVLRAERLDRAEKT